MGIKKKFLALAGCICLIVFIISCISYYIAHKNLEASVEKELLNSVNTQEISLNSWLMEKAKPGLSAAALFSRIDGTVDNNRMIDMLSLGSNDKEILNLSNGNEDGVFVSFAGGDVTGKKDSRQRPWYKDAKKAGKLVFTDAYKDATFPDTMVISAAIPYNDKNGQFRGAICDDISLKTLEKVVSTIKYEGHGQGFIIERTGKILASANKKENFTEVKDNALLKDQFNNMLQNKTGYFLATANGEKVVVAYTTVRSTNWLVGISVPEAIVFGKVASLKWIYGGLGLLALIILVFISLRFSAQITGNVIRLKKHADELSNGNFKIDDLAVTSTDEFADLTNAFNSMSHNIRSLIKNINAASDQVSTASTDLSHNAQQSAEAANNVAETVTHIANNMETQIANVNTAKNEVDTVFLDITKVTEKTNAIEKTSAKSADAAQQGKTLMENAVGKMENIEKSVLHLADIVQKLGDNSSEIGQIIDTISAIADQTNLLALNAAIEAARAGEHGKGFAVVAEEVRKLAAESQEAAEKIKDHISSIQQDTSSAVSAMETGTKEVQEGTSTIRDVGSQFVNIMKMVNEIKTQIDDISTSVTSVSNGATNIVRSVNHIDEDSHKTSDYTQTIAAAAEEQSASTEEIASAARTLSDMAEKLHATTKQFKI
ncbi:methyl-accepting chemotaxis protein [Pectinatus brassicae]|uniref:Methyl-accepting chemotaxis protein n=1 Tax=Pectinatus brassicae TaxID=862415 RepID=A0A840UWY6_9FIRM|nr:methyl-accepting chemotaxis protein [Pectinatus brassicae]MBB5336905.1 methyl-accepting chemotaxis protein [Pectinatus brassicae]